MGASHLRKIPEGRWQLTCSAEQFGDLRHDKEFWFLITVGRTINALHFALIVSRAQKERTDPASDRVRMAAFLYICGLMHEVLEFQANHFKEWGGLTTFRRVFEGLEDSQLSDRSKELLHAIRNRAAFHIDPSVPSRVLAQFPLEGYAFAVGDGAKRSRSNFELPDIVTFAFLFGSLNDLPQMYERFSGFYDELQQLTVGFIQHAEDVVLARLVERGFRFQELAQDEVADKG
jgi:hypothetical protein